MNRFKKTLAGLGLGLALGLLTLPLGTGVVEGSSNHCLVLNEAADCASYEPMAHYGMLDLTDLEQIVGRENLDQQTIQFLEWNIWDYPQYAQPAGDRDEPMTWSDYRFLELNIWGSPSLPPYGDAGGAY